MSGLRERTLTDAREARPSRGRWRHFSFGSGWRRFRFACGPARWPTVMGENPPRGLPYLCVEVSYGGRCVQLRFWNTRREVAR